MARKAGVLQRSCSTSCESSTQDARERCSELTGGTRISTASLLLNCWTGYSFVQSIHTSPDGSYGGQDMSAEWITSDYPGRCLHPGFQRSVRSAALTSPMVADWTKRWRKRTSRKQPGLCLPANEMFGETFCDLWNDFIYLFLLHLFHLIVLRP